MELAEASGGHGLHRARLRARRDDLLARLRIVGIPDAVVLGVLAHARPLPAGDCPSGLAGDDDYCTHVDEEVRPDAKRPRQAEGESVPAPQQYASEQCSLMVAAVVNSLPAIAIAACQQSHARAPTDLPGVPQRQCSEAPQEQLAAVPAVLRHRASTANPQVYREVVRGVDARAALHGYGCACCAPFYEAVDDNPVAVLLRQIAAGDAPGHRGGGGCSAAAGVNFAAAAAGPARRRPVLTASMMHADAPHRDRAGGGGRRDHYGGGGGRAAALQQAFSRHRARFEPEGTPAGYWDLGSLPNDSDIVAQPYVPQAAPARFAHPARVHPAREPARQRHPQPPRATG